MTKKRRKRKIKVGRLILLLSIIVIAVLAVLFLLKGVKKVVIDKKTMYLASDKSEVTLYNYDENNNFKEDKKQAIFFLIKLGIGWITGMVLSVLILSSIFDSHIYSISSLFTGFIIVAIPLIIKQEKDSLIGKYYDDSGVELSGGQLQKIAIARGLAKDSSLLILDEPTSALDPLAEAEIYENFNQLSKDKMAIYISHRMSSSIFCDRILVIDGGIVSDFDTHQNLMLKKNSLYYKLFTTQAKNYKL